MRVLITGGRGMLGSNLAGSAARLGSADEIVLATRADADLTNAEQTKSLVNKVKPDLIIHTAAKVGGIAANIAHPAEFLMDNTLIDSSVLNAAVEAGVSDFIYFGSSCMYPKDYRQPLVETDILAAPLEPTNEGYALSKIAAARYCEYASKEYGLNYRVLIPSNLYGPGDDYTLGTAHLVASTLTKAHEAKVNGAQSIDVWGDGSARREFTYVADVSDWVVSHLLDAASWPVYMNIGLGQDHSVEEFYRAALNVVGYDCELHFDTTKPAGMKQKLMDSTPAKAFGWDPKTSIEEGMRFAYDAYLEKTLDK